MRISLSLQKMTGNLRILTMQENEQSSVLYSRQEGTYLL